jgi:YVTN family beta-propeller protein
MGFGLVRRSGVEKIVLEFRPLRAEMKRISINLLFAIMLVAGLNYTVHPDRTSLKDLLFSSPGMAYLSPTALVVSPDATKLYLACYSANEVAVYDIGTREVVKRIEVPPYPSGLALSPDGQFLYVTCAAPKSKVCIIATKTGRVRGVMPSGHSSMAPVLSPDGTFLYVCDRFNNDVNVFDLRTRKSVGQIHVDREPVAAALSPDGKRLFVANLLHSGAADRGVVAASVSVIDTSARKLLKHIPLTNGSTLLRGICVSPDGGYVAVAHGLARFHLPTTTVAHGWMNNNVLSLIDANELSLVTTVPLDEDDRGAANPWAVQWSPDGKLICVTHAGTHEVSLIDAPRLLAKISSLPPRRDRSTLASSAAVKTAQSRDEIPNDLTFLNGLRRRVGLRGQGPRSLAMAGKKLFVANYFSDSISVLDLEAASDRSATIQLESPLSMIAARKGEMYFNDASICYQGWQSCGSCHSSDGRVDGMNWDLLNDGMGNPKNVKSLVYSFQTLPVMSLGVRSDAAGAVRAGMRHILFTNPRDDVAFAMDEFIKSLQPLPSPFLTHNGLSKPAQRGQKLFMSKDVGCVTCHPPRLWTDQKPHSVGSGKFDQATDQFYTPALVELWRTAPYLHDGSAATIQEVILKHHPGEQDGKASKLSADEISDLAAFLLSM